MAMIYADEPEARQVAGKGAWAEADSEMLEWGMGRIPPGRRHSLDVRVSRVQRKIAHVQSLPPSPERVRRLGRFRARLASLLAMRQEASIRRGVSDLPEGGSEIGNGEETYGIEDYLQVGDLWTAIGLKSPLSQYEAKGMKLPDIFRRFSSILDQYGRYVPRIPSGSTRRTLEKELRALQKARASLAPAFAPGATPGKRDRDALGNFVGGVKTFRSHINNAMKTYGIRAEAPSPEAIIAAKPKPEKKEEEGVGLPILLLGGGLLAKLLGVF